MVGEVPMPIALLSVLILDGFTLRSKNKIFSLLFERKIFYSYFLLFKKNSDETNPKTK